MITCNDYVTAILNLWLQQITKLMQQAIYSLFPTWYTVFCLRTITVVFFPLHVSGLTGPSSGGLNCTSSLWYSPPLQMSLSCGSTTKTSAEGENTIGCLYNLDLLMMGLWGLKHVEERRQQLLYVNKKAVVSSWKYRINYTEMHDQQNVKSSRHCHWNTAGLFNWATKLHLFLDSDRGKFSNKIPSRQ